MYVIETRIKGKRIQIGAYAKSRFLVQQRIQDERGRFRAALL